MVDSKKKQVGTNELLGGFTFKLDRFEGLDVLFDEFQGAAFRELPARKKFRRINESLLRLIQEAPEPAFLLAAVVEYMDRVNHAKLLHEPYRFTDFEFFLNNFSGLSNQDNYRIRGKIVGRFVPREEYQCFFPIGMGKQFPGTHFVTAHISPDVDTTVASFSGWLDAFAARVSEGLHVWSLPGGAPESHITYIMQDLFGKGIFDNLVRASGTLTLTSMDLLTQKDVVKMAPNTLTTTIEHGENTSAVILVDADGHYLGDWRSSDVETVRQVVTSFGALLRWFENNLHVQLISLFSQPKPKVTDLEPFLSSVFDACIQEIEPVRDLNEEQQRHLHAYLRLVLKLEAGIHGTFRDLTVALDSVGLHGFHTFRQNLESLTGSELFDSSGALKEDRPKIFHYLHQVINGLDNAIQALRMYIDRLDVMMSVKHQVLGQMQQFVTLRSDVEEVKAKMKHFSYLTVVIPEKNNQWFPVGVVSASDLRMPILGTVTLRDFCNLEEIKMASYLEVISVVDHHKTSLKTSTPPLALIGDAQSCNVLIAEAAFRMNDPYSTAGMTVEEVSKESKDLSQQAPSPSNARLHRRVLQRQIALHNRGHSYLHPLREYVEYLCFLYAILDDTDLLSKVSNRDVTCVAHLLNLLKSISIQRDVEVITLDDIPKDARFAKNAAKRILQNDDMYSLYKKIYDYKEKEVEDNLHLCASGKPSNIFADTKEQNGACRVGQIKLFASNQPKFSQGIDNYRRMWLRDAQRSREENPDLDLHIQMISTVTGADEVYSGNVGNYKHKDEMWIWIPTTQPATERLTSFLNSFSTAKEVINNTMEVEFLGDNAAELNDIFAQNFVSIPRNIAKKSQKDLPIAVLRYNAGSLNSRKSQITPYLPRLSLKE